MKNIKDEFLLLVKQFDRKNNLEITLDTRFKDLGIDSLTLTELILACEDKFNVRIEAEDEALAEAVVLKNLYDAVLSQFNQSVSNE